MSTHESMREDIPTRGGPVSVVRWTTGKITIENAPVFLTPRLAEKIAEALISCTRFCAAFGYSTRTPHPDRWGKRKRSPRATNTKKGA